MKTRFTINNEIFGEYDDIDESHRLYYLLYQPEGWELDKENGEVYMIIDKFINLNEGDRVDIFGFRIVTWKCLNVIDDIIQYVLEEE